jgi:6-phosphogluconolactonase
MLPSDPVSSTELIVERDLEQASRRAAEEFVRLAGEAQRQSGRFTVALSGGSTPQRLYALLAEPTYAQRVAWNKVHLFWGDERCVPPDHAESNYAMARRLLIANVPVPAGNVHRMAGEKEPAGAAAEYARGLMESFELRPGEWPRFDLMLMGIGEDGHTASLFPGHPALQNQTDLVLAPYVEKLQAHRITLTFPVINHAANIWFLVAESTKAAVLSEILKAEVSSPRLPATFVKPEDGRLVWFVTAAAATQLPQ